jgi:16S rRNA G966 N2-methylase RsmD
MRVIAGKFGSRPLKSIGGLDLRPTSDRLRETLFNVLGPAVQGSVFVDLYAGTGAVGIEAVSRGADEVFFVEKHAGTVKLIRENLRSLGITLPGEKLERPTLVGAPAVSEAGMPRAVAFPAADPAVEVLAMDAVKALGLLHQRQVLADFIFVDPPYASVGEYARVLGVLADGHVLAPAGRVIVESLRVVGKGARTPAGAEKLGPVRERRIERPASHWEPPDRIGVLERTRTVEQGDSLLVFYRLALAA